MDSCWKPRMADCTALFSNARWGITTTNLKVSLLVIATEILFSIAAPIPFSIRSAPAEQCNVSRAVDVDVVVVVVVDVDDLMLAHLPLQPPPSLLVLVVTSNSSIPFLNATTPTGTKILILDVNKLAARRAIKYMLLD